MVAHKKIHDQKNTIAQAQLAIDRKKTFFGPESERFVSEFMDLGIGDAEEIWPLLKDLFHELDLENSTHPRTLQYYSEPIIENNRFFIFEWHSKKLQKNMLLKFALNKDSFFYISLRRNRVKWWQYLVPNCFYRK